jgi:hypothetical protein
MFDGGRRVRNRVQVFITCVKDKPSMGHSPDHWNWRTSEFHGHANVNPASLELSVKSSKTEYS